MNSYLTDTWSDIEKHYPEDSWNDIGGPNIYGCLKQLFLLKQKHRNFKTLLSIGGWTYSANFAAPAATPEGRQKFAESAVTLLKDCGFDGLDIDWEYPKDAKEANNLVLLLKATRTALDTYAKRVGVHPKRLLLTVACPAGAANFEKMQLREMDQVLSFWNLMAYDYAGSWDSVAGHQANVFPSRQAPNSTPFSSSAAVDHYIQQGVHPGKIVLGCPLYGRAFCNTAGPGTPFDGVGEGSWEKGVWDWKVLPLAGHQLHEDMEAIASWSHDPASGTMVSFDTVKVAEQKANWVRERGLGGVMWWESSGDLGPAGGVVSLVTRTLVGQGHGMEYVENVIHYPESQYENLRKGFV